MNEIRRKMPGVRALQQAADALLADIARSRGIALGEEMLAFIIDRVRQGTALSDEYPEFQQILEDDPALQQAFEELLAFFDEDPDLPEGILPTTREDLAFLGKSQPEMTETGQTPGWPLVLQQSLKTLQRLFTPPALAYRDALNALDSGWYTLLREEVETGGARLGIVLDASVSQERAESLALLLQIAVVDLDEGHNLPDQLTADLTWGKYHSQTAAALNAQTFLPEAAFSDVLTPDRQAVAAGLTLRLHASEA